MSDSDIVVRRYGLLQPLDWQKDGPAVDAEMRAMTALWNRLVEIEREHRAAYIAATADDPQVIEAEARIESLRERRQQLIDERKARRKAARSRVDTPDLDEEIAALKPLIAEAVEQVRAARKEARERVKPKLEALEKARREKVKEARHPKNSHLYWGNYNAVITAYERARRQAMKRGGELQFRGWRGEGRLVNQIQGGMSVDALMQSKHSQVRVSDDPLPADGERGRRHAQTRKALTVMVHSEGRGATRHTLTAPMIMHRPIPEDATIKEVTVTRRKVACHERWHVVMMARAPARPKAPPKDGVRTAVNFGWRRVPEGLRIATVLRAGQSPQYVVLPDAILDGHARVRHLQSTRDHDLIEALAWVRSLDFSEAPDDVAEAWARLKRAPKPTQRSVARLALAWRPHQHWRNEDYRAIEAIRKRDKRLWIEMEHLRDKLLARRRDIYHNAANAIVSGASEIIVDGADWSQLARKEQPDGSETELWQGIRRNRQIAAVSDLRLLITQKAAARGVPVRVHKGPTTWRCHRCGHEIEKRRPAELYQFCGHCDPDHVHPIDQDENAVRVMVDAAE